MTEVQTTDQIDAVSRQVRAELTFDHRYGIDEHPTRGNCYEFAMRTHDLAHCLGYYSFIGYSYDHAFNIGSKDGDLYLVSSDAPGLSVLEDGRRSLAGLLPGQSEPVAENIRSDSLADTVTGLINLRTIPDQISLSAANAIEAYNAWHSKAWLKSVMPAVTIMRPAFARDALTNYFSFRRSLAEKSFEETRDSLEALRIRTPQHETRPKYNSELVEFKRAVRFMSRTSSEIGVSSLDLRELVASYADILPSTNTAANTVFGDCYRAIGLEMGDHKALEDALKTYDLAAHFSRKRRGCDNEVIKNKASKLESLILQPS